MIIFVEDSALVVSGYERQFSGLGEKIIRMSSDDFDDWVAFPDAESVASVEAFLFGNCENLKTKIGSAKSISTAPIISLLEQRSLERIVSLFQYGSDDVVAKPVHFDELMARIAAIKKRLVGAVQSSRMDAIRIYFDGRDPEYGNKPITLPRRQRRILEYLASIRGRRVTKAQIFSAVYGIFDEHIEENVVESHISKLRKKLRESIGKDPIDSKRYLGYRLNPNIIDLVKRVDATQDQLAAA